MLTVRDIERLSVLVSHAQYDGDAELTLKLALMRKREESRASINRTDEHGKEVPVDGKRRSS